MRCAGEAGKTDTSAPLSTKKDLRCRRQKTERAPLLEDAEKRVEIIGDTPGAIIGPRPGRFPGQRTVQQRAEDEA